MNEETLKLHDIKNIVSIPDNSIFIFSFLVFLVFLLLLSLIFFIIKKIKNKKQNIKKKYFKKLQEIDYSNSKECAYKITKYLRVLASSNREKKLAHEIIEELEKYKYKKEVKEIKEELKAKISTFMDAVDV